MRVSLRLSCQGGPGKPPTRGQVLLAHVGNLHQIPSDRDRASAEQHPSTRSILPLPVRSNRTSSSCLCATIPWAAQVGCSSLMHPLLLCQPEIRQVFQPNLTQRHSVVDRAVGGIRVKRPRL